MTDTLKSICKRYGPYLNNPELDFIPAGFVQHRAIILRDIRELVLAAGAELEKSVVLMAGSIIEGLLYTFIEGQQLYIASRRGGVFTFDPEGGLQHYKNVFDRWFRDALPNAALPDSIVDYRNLVHINRELKSPADVCSRASRDMLRTLNSLLGELSRFPPSA